MTQVATEERAPRERSSSRSNLWPIAGWIFAIVAASLFLFNGVRYANETQHELRLIPWLSYDNRVDFAYFFSGAYIAWRGHATDLYPGPGEWTYYPDDPIFDEAPDQFTLARLLARGNYYNPPLLAYLQGPLTTLSFRDAFWVFSLLSVGMLGGYAGLAWWAGRGVKELPLLIMGAIAFKPVHEAIIMGHVALFFAFALTAGFLLLRSNRPLLAGLVLSFLALKPQWAILPAVFLLARREYRALAMMIVASSVLVFAPFFAIGFKTFFNYIEFLRYSGPIDLHDAPHMFSWNGFISKLTQLTGDCINPDPHPPSPTYTYALIGLTAVPFLLVLKSRDFLLGAAATVVAMLLISTHSVWYDWALLIVAALFLVLRPMRQGMRVELWVLLLGLYVASSQSIAELLYPERHFICWHRPAFFSITPVAFASLVWMASVAWRDGLLTLPRFSRRGPPRSDGSVPRPQG